MSDYVFIDNNTLDNLNIDMVGGNFDFLGVYRMEDEDGKFDGNATPLDHLYTGANNFDNKAEDN